MSHKTNLWCYLCKSMVTWMQILALQTSLGLVTVWACNFFNVSELQFLNQANGDNCTDLKAVLKIEWYDLFIALYKKSVTPSSHIFMNLGQSIANKKRTPLWWFLLAQFSAEDWKGILPGLPSLESPRERWAVPADAIPVRSDDWGLIQNTESPLSYWTVAM